MADNNKDDIEILDFVDNELMEISQEEMDQMQSAFEELEASGDSDDLAEGSGEAEDASAVVQPKSVDTRFSEPVDAGDLGDLDLGDADLGDEDDTEAKEAPAEEIKELSLDSSDVLADVNDVDAMLKDALGDLGDLDDLEDFDANELSSDLDESLLKEPEGAEEKADDAVEAVAEEAAEEKDPDPGSRQSNQIHQEGSGQAYIQEGQRNIHQGQVSQDVKESPEEICK